jgi:hypothetical protein
MKVSCLTVSFLILERICEVASIGGLTARFDKFFASVIQKQSVHLDNLPRLMGDRKAPCDASVSRPALP